MNYGLTLGSATESLFRGLSDTGLADLIALKALGFTSVRINATYVASLPIVNDLLVRTALDGGLDVLLVFNGYHAATVSAAQFATFAGSVAALYGPLGAHEYEILNEPNQTTNWDPANGVINPGSYTALLKDTYAAVKSADPQSTVVLGGLATYGAYQAPSGSWNGTAWTGGSPPGAYGGSYDTSNGNYSGTVNPVAWLQSIYVAGGQGYFDVVSAHPYCYPVLPTSEADWSGWYQMYGTLYTSLLSLMQANGDGAKPIWVTEFGVQTAETPDFASTFPAAFQAGSMAVAVEQALANAPIKRLMFFDALDTAGDGAWGLYEATGHPKVSLGAALSAMSRPTNRFVALGSQRGRFAAQLLPET